MALAESQMYLVLGFETYIAPPRPSAEFLEKSIVASGDICMEDDMRESAPPFCA